MKNLSKILFFFIITFIFYTCKSDSRDSGPAPIGATGVSGAFDSKVGSSGAASSPSPNNGNGGIPIQAGLITAGEWNDLDNWKFWNDILKKTDYSSMQSYWKFYLNNRFSVSLTNSDMLPMADVVIKLKRDGKTIFTSKTDNKGKAELWSDLFQENQQIDISKYTIDINNGTKIISSPKLHEKGVNEIKLASLKSNNNIEIAFVVDATGSMGDELKYLKTELLDVINSVKNSNPKSKIITSSIFYRDKGDDYITRVSNFTNNANTTIDFIKKQEAGGGGDFPEAVHSALDKSVNELNWSAESKTRILFLVLDAPPHYTDPIVEDIQNSIKKATEMGIKIIPITASGIDKKTEFLMRFMSISTNGTYVFITNHSGIGNQHLIASVGDYKVEYLNNLMVRLINKYSE